LRLQEEASIVAGALLFLKGINYDKRDARNQGYKEALKYVEEIIGELKIDLEGKYRTWIGWVKVEELKQKLNGVGK